MNRPLPRQWAVLWLGAAWILLTLAVAEEYVLRGVFAALVVSGLLYWQLAPRSSQTKADSENPSADLDAPLHEAAVKGFRTPDAVGQISNVTDTVVAPAAVGPSGIAGWLALLVLGLGLGIPVSAVNETINSASSVGDRWEFGGVLAVTTYFVAGGLYAAIALCLRWPNAPKLAKVFIGSVAVLGVIGLASSMTEATTDAAETAGQIVGALVWATVWLSYLSKSKRVRNTYSPEATVAHRTSARIGTATVAAAVMWLGVTVYSNAESRIEQQYSQINPYQWIRASQQMDSQFADGFTEGVLARLRPTLGNSTLTPVGAADLADLGTSFRAIVRYTAEVANDQTSTTKLAGEVRTYFHVNGIAVIESACAVDVLDCSGMQRLIEEGEESLSPRLNGSQLSGILPDGECELETNTLSNGRSTQMITCSYTDTGAALLSLARSSLSEAREDMQGRVNATSDFKRALVKQIEALP